MSTPTVASSVGSPDDWTFWDLVYSDPELVSWELQDDPHTPVDHHATSGGQ